MPTSNIDEILMGGKFSTQQPATPENQYQEQPETIDNDTPDYGEDVQEVKEYQTSQEDNNAQDEDTALETKKPERITDEYGNDTQPENEAIRERLARQARKHQAEIDNLRAQLAQQGASREVQQAASDFEYNPDSSGDWQQQLASFVKQTVSSMSREESESKQRHADAQLQQEFETKFRAGIEKFPDFVDVVSELPFEISNPMTLATRAMSDPAAFLYAAAKRQPAELERISKIRDPYAQMTEMGKLEERMRRNKPTTTAPRPLGRVVEDAPERTVTKKKEPSIEDLLKDADAKRLAKRRATPKPMARR